MGRFVVTRRLVLQASFCQWLWFLSASQMDEPLSGHLAISARGVSCICPAGKGYTGIYSHASSGFVKCGYGTKPQQDTDPRCKGGEYGCTCGNPSHANASRNGSVERRA